MKWNRCLSLLIVLPVVSGCIPLPAPSIVRMDDKLALGEHPLAKEDTVLIFGHNAEPPSPPGIFSFYFIFGCRHAAYQQDTISRLGESVYAANRTILGPKGLADEMGYLVIPEGEDWKPPDALSRELSQAHVRYLVSVAENVDTTIHVPLYVSPYGVAACGHKTTLEARIWELPSGRFLGSVSTSATGEFVLLAYVVHFIFVPETQERATAELADELLRKLAADEPDRAAAPLSN